MYFNNNKTNSRNSKKSKWFLEVKNYESEITAHLDILDYDTSYFINYFAEWLYVCNQKEMHEKIPNVMLKLSFSTECFNICLISVYRRLPK